MSKVDRMGRFPKVFKFGLFDKLVSDDIALHVGKVNLSESTHLPPETPSHYLYWQLLAGLSSSPGPILSWSEGCGESNRSVGKAKIRPGVSFSGSLSDCLN